MHLIILDGNDRITQQEIVNRATSDLINSIRAILLLEKRGLITRARYPEDGRALCVSMTQKGSTLFNILVDGVIRIRDKMLTIFIETETKAIFNVLYRLARKLD